MLSYHARNGSTDGFTKKDLQRTDQGVAYGYAHHIDAASLKLLTSQISPAKESQ